MNLALEKGTTLPVGNVFQPQILYKWGNISVASLSCYYTLLLLFLLTFPSLSTLTVAREEFCVCVFMCVPAEVLGFLPWKAACKPLCRKVPSDTEVSQ